MDECCFSPDSDVYMHSTVETTITRGERTIVVCRSCKLALHEDRHFDTPKEAIVHLGEHMAKGHRVPDRLFDRLENEQALWTTEETDE